jgi:hypothetical protein
MKLGPYNAIKVFSATKAADREKLGERITSWLRDHPQYRIAGAAVNLSSDESFHCLSVTVFYWEDASAAATGGAA